MLLIRCDVTISKFVSSFVKYYWYIFGRYKKRNSVSQTQEDGSESSLKTVNRHIISLGTIILYCEYEEYSGSVDMQYTYCVTLNLGTTV